MMCMLVNMYTYEFVKPNFFDKDKRDLPHKLMRDKRVLLLPYIYIYKEMALSELGFPQFPVGHLNSQFLPP